MGGCGKAWAGASGKIHRAWSGHWRQPWPQPQPDHARSCPTTPDHARPRPTTPDHARRLGPRTCPTTRRRCVGRSSASFSRQALRQPPPPPPPPPQPQPQPPPTRQAAHGLERDMQTRQGPFHRRGYTAHPPAAAASAAVGKQAIACNAHGGPCVMRAGRRLPTGSSSICYWYAASARHVW